MKNNKQEIKKKTNLKENNDSLTKETSNRNEHVNLNSNPLVTPTLTDSNYKKSDTDCHFYLDAVIDNDVLSENVSTYDTTVKGDLYVTQKCEILKDVTITESLQVNGGLTEASSIDITPAENSDDSQNSQVSVNLNNNRITNIKVPGDDENTSPVPAFFAPSCEYMFVSTRLYQRVYMRAINDKLPLLQSGRLVYKSPAAEQCFRIVDFQYTAQKNRTRQIYLTHPGYRAFQLLKRGTYIFDMLLVKRWGWNNGWGGVFQLVKADDTQSNAEAKEKILTETTLHVGGGYSMQGTLNTIIHVEKSTHNPDTDFSHLYYVFFSFGKDKNIADLGSVVWSIIYYPDLEKGE